MLTPIERQGNYWVKREDYAGYVGPEYPSGSKVRQYNKMALAAPGAPMIVGCASTSAMQIYVAAAAKQNNVPAIVITAKTNKLTSATQYAKDLGAEIHEYRPGYMNVLRSRAKRRAQELGKTVRWDVKGAIDDASAQVDNLPDCRSVVIPTGSGLTAVGVLVGLAKAGKTNVVVHVITVSTLASADGILKLTEKVMGAVGSFGKPKLPTLMLTRHPSKYSKPLIRTLPDGTPLDPFYAAKAIDYVSEDDVLWVPGLRPVRSMPEPCRVAFSSWPGFKASYL